MVKISHYATIVVNILVNNSANMSTSYNELIHTLYSQRGSHKRTYIHAQYCSRMVALIAILLFLLWFNEACLLHTYHSLTVVEFNTSTEPAIENLCLATGQAWTTMVQGKTAVKACNRMLFN